MAKLDLALEFTGDENPTPPEVAIRITPEGDVELRALNLADEAQVGVLLLEIARVIAENHPRGASFGVQPEAKRPPFAPRPVG